jgi:hypothetical protein
LKIGIFIQGPVISTGRTGESLSTDPLKPGKNSNYENFNCIENINSSYKNYSKYFDEVLITLWKSDLIYLPHLDIPIHSIIVIEDIQTVKNLNHLQSFQNSQRQYVSSLVGIEELYRRNCHAVIKTRSDQFLDANLLSKNLTNSKNRNLILFPYRDASNFDLISDFYIGGPTSNLLEIFTSLTQDPRFSQNVHFDIYYKSWINFQNVEKFKIRLPHNPRYFDEFARPIISKFAYGEFSEYLSSMDTRWLGTFDHAIWQNMTWRGKRPIKVISNLSVPSKEKPKIQSFLKRTLFKALIGKF